MPCIRDTFYNRWQMGRAHNCHTSRVSHRVRQFGSQYRIADHGCRISYGYDLPLVDHDGLSPCIVDFPGIDRKSSGYLWKETDLSVWNSDLFPCFPFYDPGAFNDTPHRNQG